MSPQAELMADQFVVSESGFRLLTSIVRQYSGICVGDDKRQLLINRLRRRVVELNLSSIDDYGQYVSADTSGVEIETLVDLMTTNHTGFFREAEHFSVVFDALVPKMRSMMSAEEPFRLWSSASASGEEPYTLAMFAAEATRRQPGLKFSILASDISRRMIEVARRGLYSMQSVEVVPKNFLHRYFERGVGPQEGRCRLRHAVRESVLFQRINLLDREYPVGHRQHVIFCRNVMIYFDVDTRRAVVERLLSNLHPSGYLVVGCSESLLGLIPGLQSVHHGIYTRS
jgi:chemotaxis protein methyltransferase CheR